jgi:hypothetical protein
MSDLKYLQLQPVEPNDDGTSNSPLDDYQQDETILLEADLDAADLDQKWQQIVDDIEKDPEWFTFANK